MGYVKRYSGVKRIQIVDLKLPDTLPPIPHELSVYLLSIDTKQWPLITISASNEVIDGLKRVALCKREGFKSLNGIQEK